MLLLAVVYDRNAVTENDEVCDVLGTREIGGVVFETYGIVILEEVSHLESEPLEYLAGSPRTSLKVTRVVGSLQTFLWD